MSIIWSIIAGGIAGWIASIIMKKDSNSLVTNVIIGMIGTWIGSALFGSNGIFFGVIGACILIWLIDRFNLMDKIKR